ncbi:hypothetical protein ACFWA6_02015 [Streptomyces sp. NPDC060020]|uniref:hypothetical protein n=1 Tax=Streptomyces sp. NPDC060020 TaxID=3347038 RepID=UPI00367D26B1
MTRLRKTGRFGVTALAVATPAATALPAPAQAPPDPAATPPSCCAVNSSRRSSSRP